MKILESATFCRLIYNINNHIIEYNPNNELENQLFKNTLKKKLTYHKGEKHDGEVVTTETLDGNTLIIGFIGTDTKQDWKQNFDFLTAEIEPNTSIYCHEGFLQQYCEIKSYINDKLANFKGENVFITGHSLGGALSTLCGYFTKTHFSKFNVKIITFGAPRSGDANFVIWYNENIKDFTRVVNHYDAICNLPPSGKILHYKHINCNLYYFKHLDCIRYCPQRTWWDRLVTLFTKSVNHDINIYIKHIEINNILD